LGGIFPQIQGVVKQLTTPSFAVSVEAANHVDVVGHINLNEW
jgi:hypothetical protein